MYKEIRSSIKEFQRKIGKLILDKKKSEKIPKFEDIKKILFIRYDGKIGDYMVSSFVYREIKKQRPDIQIDVVGISKNESLFLKNKNVDNFYKLKKTKYRYLAPLGRFLRKKNYDLLIDPTEVLKNKDLFFIRKINAKVNYGYAKENYKIFNYSVPKNNKHITEVYNEILLKSGFKNIKTAYDVPLNEESEKKIRQFFIENSFGKVIVLNLFGAKKKTKFTFEKSIQLINYIMEMKKDHKVVLLYSPADIDIIDKILKYYPNNTVFYYKDSKNIFDNISILKRSDMVISPDTSIVHIADGFNKNIIAFYTNNLEDFQKWKIRDGNKIIRLDNVNNLKLDFFD